MFTSMLLHMYQIFSYCEVIFIFQCSFPFTFMETFLWITRYQKKQQPQEQQLTTPFLLRQKAEKNAGFLGSLAKAEEDEDDDDSNSKGTSCLQSWLFSFHHNIVCMSNDICKQQNFVMTANTSPIGQRCAL